MIQSKIPALDASFISSCLEKRSDTVIAYIIQINVQINATKKYTFDKISFFLLSPFFFIWPDWFKLVFYY